MVFYLFLGHQYDLPKPVEIEEHPPRLQGHHGKLRGGERSELLLVKHGDFNGIYWDFMGIYGDSYGIL